jgi:hypothetical protein
MIDGLLKNNLKPNKHQEFIIDVYENSTLDEVCGSRRDGSSTSLLSLRIIAPQII